MPDAEIITTPPPRRGRAAPMAPDERRAAIIAATIPLLHVHGTSVTTRQIAEAADVAEGTIFRVFTDKESLICAAVNTAMDPTEVEARLDTIDLDQPLDERLTAAAAIVQQRMMAVFNLATKLGLVKPPDPGHGTPREAPALSGIVERFVTLIEPDRDQLRCDPAEAARLLRVISFAASHPAINDGVALTPAEITALLLDGIRTHAGRGAPTTAEPSAGAHPC